MPFNKFKEIEFLENFKKLIKERNLIVHEQPKRNNFFQPDLLIEKDNKKFIIEIKTNERIKPQAIYQIISYLFKDKSIDGAYLAVPSYSKISPFVQKKIIQHGIGLIKLKDNNLNFLIEPLDKPKIFEKLASKKTKLILDKLNPRERGELFNDFFRKIGDIFEKSLEKRDIEDFPKNIFIFIILGSILGSSLWEIMHFLLDSSGKYSILIVSSIFLTSLLIILIYYMSIRNN